jgi:hypothetical protein
LDIETLRPIFAGMTTLSDIRDRIRIDLHDPVTGDERWSDDQLDRHIEHALEEVSLASPRELTATVSTTAGSRDLSVADIDGLIEVERVEFPAGRFPACFVEFTRWADTLTLGLRSVPNGDDAVVYHTARHSIDDSASTLPPFLEGLVVTGAGAYAVLEQSAFTIDTLNTGGAAVSERMGGWARARLIAFNQLLLQYGRNNRVRQRRLRPRA